MRARGVRRGGRVQRVRRVRGVSQRRRQAMEARVRRAESEGGTRVRRRGAESWTRGGGARGGRWAGLRCWDVRCSLAQGPAWLARPGLRSGQVSGQAQLAAGARPTVDVSEVRVLTGMRPRGPAMTPRPAGPSLMRVYCSPSNAGGSKGSAKTGQPWALGPAGGLHVETDQG